MTDDRTGYERRLTTIGDMVDWCATYANCDECDYRTECEALFGWIHDGKVLPLVRSWMTEEQYEQVRDLFLEDLQDLCEGSEVECAFCPVEWLCDYRLELEREYDAKGQLAMDSLDRMKGW